MKYYLLIAVSLLLAVNQIAFCQAKPKNYGKLKSEVFAGKPGDTLMVVAFGGSEGGNMFAEEKTEDVRARFHQRGFHFVAISYFGGRGLPKDIDRISLGAIHDTISHISSRLDIKPSNVLLLGASRGGELVLNLGSRTECLGVVALVPSSITVANISSKVATSSWTWKDEEIPFLKMDSKIVKTDGWAKALTRAMLKEENYRTAAIPVEKIPGFVFLSSGKEDDLWPSYRMCNDIADRLKKKDFEKPYLHKAFDGGHSPSGHWDEVFEFLDRNMTDRN